MAISKTPRFCKPLQRKWTVISILLAITVAVSIALALTLTLTRKTDRPEVAPDEPPESTYPDPVIMDGTIPNNQNWRTMDPSLIRRVSDGKLFLFTTGAFGEPNGTVWTSDSLYGPWEKSPLPMIDQQAGGPQVYYVNGTYYMFHNHHFDYFTIGVTHASADKWWHDNSVYVRSSQSMEHGTWAYHGKLGIIWQVEYNILDPSLLTVYNTTDQTHQNYLSFGSYQTGLFQVPLAHPPTNLTIDGMAQIKHLEQNATNISTGVKDRTEASFQYFRDGWYYLFFSSGICCHLDDSWTQAIEDPYHVMVCRSSQPRGGFVDKANTDCLSGNGGTQILATHGSIFVPGGQGVMDDEEAEGPIIYYHYGEYSFIF